jgi:hypothetical protein
MICTSSHILLRCSNAEGVNGHVVRTGEKGEAQRCLVGKPVKNRQLERPMIR